ncbi:hypothetical protein IGB42_01325 [Andreprevotia sp. IGB-42]|uniref:DUF2271 domain-containing protein n=1 Tax=Andreprevotia sp. IGB-42 TaxID=2497473 RepID=UPI00135817C8|nr:DUF2271 domain-containing protein [Andreprevotia sp. IGB-42]KAF0814424.1 hypothetical protein IGB42_01325 [Andreprevotia sp. IGB-42]
MRKSIPALLPGLIAGAFAGHGIAADLGVKIEIPRLTVAEYHRPYVAAWIERADQSVAANLAVLYDVNKKGAEPGTKWLQDLRQWWRKGGRDLQMPLDGVSGATRPVGEHALNIDKATLAKLPAGDYNLAVEAAREGGGRELVRVPFSWPPKKADTAKIQGQHELGAVTVDLKP